MKMLNAGDYEGASTQFERWNKSKGTVLQGLVKRRKKEKELFLS
jgi:lysozyme